MSVSKTDAFPLGYIPRKDKRLKFSFF